MKKIKKLLTVIILAISAIVMLPACTKEAKTGSATSSDIKVRTLQPAKAEAGSVITITGSGLGSIASIAFEKGNVPASINPNISADNQLIFPVPDTANGGAQNIILTNTFGKKAKIPFNVVAIASVTDVSNYNFTEGTEITLSGNNLADVTSVKLSGTGSTAYIISKARKQLVIKMNAQTANQAKLEITNSSGSILTSQDFVNIDNAYTIFTEGYMNDWHDISWGSVEISNTIAKSGTKSFCGIYSKGNRHAKGFANWGQGIDKDPAYKFISFWVRGGLIDHTLYLIGDRKAKGYSNDDESVPFLAKAGIWTYHKIPLSIVDYWNTGTKATALGFWIKGPDNDTESIYFDDVMFVKE